MASHVDLPIAALAIVTHLNDLTKIILLIKCRLQGTIQITNTESTLFSWNQNATQVLLSFRHGPLV